MRPSFLKLVAVGLALALVLVSPGPLAYSAFAAQPAGASGLPNGAGSAPRLQALAGQASRHDGARRRGVDVGEILRDLQSVDLSSPAGRLAASPVLQRLASKPGATEDEVLDALADAALEQRAASARLTESIDAGADLESARELTIALRVARRHDVLLGRDERERLLSRAAAYSARLEDARQTQAAAMIRRAVDAWKPAALEPAAVASIDAPAPRPNGLAAAAKTAPAETAAPAVEKTSSLELSRRDAAPSGARLAAKAALMTGLAAGAVLALAPVSPALALAAGVAASILLHEQAHLWLLRYFGDDTALRAGVTSAWSLLDWRWTVSLPVAAAAVSSLLSGPLVLAGWAKPIPVDFNKLRVPKKHAGIVSLGGVAKNVALAAVFAGAAAALPAGMAAAAVLALLAKINVALAAFNLLPMPHLDGGKALVALMPQSWYARWTHNDKVPDAYQSTFQHLYDGPNALLNLLSLTGQKSVNALALGVTAGLFLLLSAAGWWFLGLPVAMLVLICSYDYYCIREKIQNEDAVNELIGIVSGVASALKAEFKADPTVKSKMNTEEVEHMLKNALEDTVDKAVDSEGFESLDEDQKWERFRGLYLDAAVAMLKQKGMTQDDPETIRRVLTGAAGAKYLLDLRAWIERTGVWRKWHSPARKAARAEAEEGAKPAGKQKEIGGATTAMLALTAVGAALLAATGALPDAAALAAAGGGALMAGTLAPAAPAPAAPPSLAELAASHELNLDPKQQKLLTTLVSDMREIKRAEVVGRVEQAGKLVDTVTAPRGFSSSAILVGKAGTGKTATVEKVAQGMIDATFPIEKMQGRYLLKLSRRKLLREQDPAAAFDELLDVLRRLNGEDPRSGNKAVLFIDEIHELFKTPKLAAIPDLIKEAMDKGQSSIILATTLSEFQEHIEKDEGFTRRAKPIMIDEATTAETQQMLEAAKSHYEQAFGVEIEPAALVTANEESRHDQKVHLPGRAFKYLDAAANVADFPGQRDRLSRRIKDRISRLKYTLGLLAAESARTDLVTDGIKKDDPTVVDLYNTAAALTDELIALYRRRDAVPSSGTPVLTADMVAAEIEFETGVTAARGKPDIAKKILTLAANVKKRVIGQDHAVDAVAAALEESQAGVKPDPNSPIGVFYVTGPTGSGKTHLARELARELFDDPDAMIRVDMTEYMEPHTVSQFKGSPPGYVGHASGGQLTEKVRRKPYSIILFDEVEKAHPDVWMLMLQIMGEGRLTDGQGRLVDFKNTLILMSSNLGMHAVDVGAYAAQFAELQRLQREAWAKGDQATADMLEAQKKALAAEASAATRARAEQVTAQAFKEVYAPEFRGRLTTDPIVFNRVTPEMAVDISGLELEGLKKILRRAGHELTWTPQVAAVIANEGYSLDLGARPIKNALRRLVTQPLAKAVLKTVVENGGAADGLDVKLSVEKGAISFAVTRRERKAAPRGEPSEGAAQEVFNRLFSSALKAAAGAAAVPGESEVDSWFKTAVAAFPAAAASAPAQTAETPRAPASVEPARPSAAAPASPSLLENAPAPETAQARAFNAAHNLHDAKDANLHSAADALAAAMEKAGFTQAARDVVLRDVEDAADPYVGFLELFVEQAKKMAGAQAAPITVAYEDAAGPLRVIVRRQGSLGEKERALLKRHFTGSVPFDSRDARDRAEGYQSRGEDARRLLFDLYRKLSAVPGARLGAAEKNGYVEYWLELPAPAAKSAPAVETSPPAETAQAGPAPEAEEGVSSAAETDPAPAAEPADAPTRLPHQRRLDALPAEAAAARDAEGLVWIEFKPTRQNPSRRLVENTLARIVQGAGLEYTGFENDGAVTRVFARARDAKAALGAARALILRATNAKRVLIHPKALQRAAAAAPPVLPPALPSRPAPPRAARPAPAPAPADPDAAFLAKIETQAVHAVDDGENLVWVTFKLATLGSRYQLDNYVKPVFERERLDVGTVIEDKEKKTLKVSGRARGAKQAGDAAFALAQDLQVTRVEVHPEARPHAKRRPKEELHGGVVGTPGERRALPAPIVAKMKKFASALLAQGDKRSTSARVAAADLFAAASTPEDLDQARAWLADENLNQSWAQAAAGAAVVARHGGGAADEALLLKLLGRLEISRRYDGHQYNPLKSRASRALATLLEKTPSSVLMSRLLDEKKKAGNASGVVAEERYGAYHNQRLEDALYRALTRAAGAEALGLLLEEWQIHRAPELFDYLKRVDAIRLEALYAGWKREPKAVPSGLERQLLPLAIAEYGDAEDAAALFELVVTGWEGQIDRSNAAAISSALGRMIARTKAFPKISEAVRRNLRSRLNDFLDFARVTGSLYAAADGGGAEQLEQIWDILTTNPQTVNPAHEMTQQDAAEGWGRLLHRLGLVESNLTEARATASGGHEALPLLQAMLVDRNPLLNKAAMEALRLSILEGSAKAAPSAAAPAKAARPIEAQWLLREGPAALGGLSFKVGYDKTDDPTNESSRFDLHDMPQDKRMLAELWARRMAKLLGAILGVPFSAQARVFTSKKGEKTIFWVLRQAAGAVPTKSAVEKAADVVAELVLIAQQSRGPARLAQLAAKYADGLDDPEALVNMLARVQARGFKMTLDREAIHPNENQEDSEYGSAGPRAVELSLRIDPPAKALEGDERAAAEERARARRYAHRLYDDGDVDPRTGRPWGQ